MAIDENGVADHESQADHSGVGFGWLSSFACALILYVATSSRGPQWQDSGEHILRVVNGDLVHRLGLALSHPLHYWLGRASLWIPGLEPAFAITLVSALAGAIAVANVWGCVHSLTRARAASWLAAGGLGLAHTMWQLSTRAEVYTLTAALFSGECWCVALFAVTRKRRFLWAVFLLNGLGLANHLQAVLTTPVLAVVALVSWRASTIRVADLLACAATWVIASLPYTGLVGLQMLRADGHPSAVVYSALFGSSYADEVLGVGVSAGVLMIAAAFILLNFPNFQLPACVRGAVAGRSVRIPVMLRRALIVALIVHAAFALRYDVVDQYTFFLPMYVVLSVLAGLGYARWWTTSSSTSARVLRSTSTFLLLITPMVYMVAPAVARSLNVLEEFERGKPYRDDYAYLLTPWSGFERSAERMTDHAVQLARPGGLILVEDAMAMFAIEYGVRRAGLKNLVVTQDTLPTQIRDAYHAYGRVVLVPAVADAPRTTAPFGSWHRDGDLYVLHAEDR